MTAAPRTFRPPSDPFLWTLLRWLGGWVTLAALAYLLWSPGDWPTRLFAWVFLVILADEFSGWFGYVALFLGGLPFFNSHAPPEQWFMIVPLVGGALLALLLVKHSGGLLVLPFAAVLFAAPILLLAKVYDKLDPQLTFPGNKQFQQTALIAMLLGLALSLVRHIVKLSLLFLHRQALKREAQQQRDQRLRFPVKSRGGDLSAPTVLDTPQLDSAEPANTEVEPAPTFQFSVVPPSVPAPKPSADAVILDLAPPKPKEGDNSDS